MYGENISPSRKIPYVPYKKINKKNLKQWTALLVVGGGGGGGFVSAD